MEFASTYGKYGGRTYGQQWVPLEMDTTSMFLPSRSSLQSDMTRGHHLLTINRYSHTKGIPTGECVRSPPFILCGHRWRIDWYPNGSSEEVADYISLSLVLDEEVASVVRVRFYFSFGDGVADGVADGVEEAWIVEARQAEGVASASMDEFNSWDAWQQSTFITREDLENSKHLYEDSFTIRCDIVVYDFMAVHEPMPRFVSVPPCDLRENLIRLLESKMGADVVFQVGSETFPAHRCVLAASSSVFATDFFGLMTEGNAAGLVVPVEDIKPEVFMALLRFAYTGWLPEMCKEEEQVTCQHLLVAADRYDMGRLKLLCEEKLCEYIDVGTVVSILMLAEHHHCEGLKKACFHFLAAPEKMRAVMATDGLQHMSVSCPSLMVELILMFTEPSYG